jgi:hypothetical protein
MTNPETARKLTIDERRTTMQTKTARVVAILCALSALTAGASANDDSSRSNSKRCTSALIKGTYIGKGSGWITFEGNTIIFSVITRLTLDGHGNATGKLTEKVAGEEVEKDDVSGTYTLDADCLGSATLTQEEGAETHDFAIIVSPDGREIEAVSTEVPVSLQLTLRRVDGDR